VRSKATVFNQENFKQTENLRYSLSCLPAFSKKYYGKDFMAIQFICWKNQVEMKK